jgi:hypothetical protein
MAQVYANSGNQPFGGVEITIGSVVYRAINWGPQIPTREVARTDIYGDRSDFQLREEPINGTVTLQVPFSNTTVATIGATFVDPDNASRTYVISSVQKTRPMGDFWVLDISFTQSTGPGTPTT